MKDDRKQHYHELKLMMPSDGEVYDYVFDKTKSNWTTWMNTQPRFTVDPEMQFHEVIVPTVESIRSLYLESMVMVVHGVAGTEKNGG